jgi:8-oxo-dGTP diphosphatase
MTPDDLPLYQRDPAAWQRHLAEGNATQPRKRIGADALIRDEQGRILLVDPTYKPDWDLPGGMAESNEPPHEAVRRELREELGLDLHVGRMLCVDWVPPHGPWDDALMFVFDGGVLDADRTKTLRPVDDELASLAFCTAEEASSRLRPYVWHRAWAAIGALNTGEPTYLTHGLPPG